MYSTKLIHFSETACSTAPQNAIWPSPFECFATGYNNNNRISQRQCKMVRQVPLNSAQWCVSWPGAPHWVACLRTHNPDWLGRRWVPGLQAASVLPISFESRWVQEEKGGLCTMTKALPVPCMTPTTSLPPMGNKHVNPRPQAEGAALRSADRLKHCRTRGD